MGPGLDIGLAQSIANQHPDLLGGDPNQAYRGMQTTSAQVAAPSSGNFLSNLGHSVIGAAKGIAGSVVGSIVNPMHDASNIIAGTQSAASRSQSSVQQLENIRQSQAHYTQQYKLGKITKDRYNALIKDLATQSQQVSQQTQDLTKEIGTPMSRAKTGAQVGGTLLTLAAPGIEPLAAAGLGEDATVASKALDTVNSGINSALGLGKGNLATKALLNTVQTQPLINAPGQIVGDIKSKNYKDLAIQAGTLVGAPLAVAGAEKYGGKALAAAGDALFGKTGSIVNALHFKDGTISDALKGLQRSNPEQAQKYEQIARQVQQHMMDERKTPAQVAAFYASGNKLGNQTVQQFLDQAAQHIGADQIAAKSGNIAMRWDNTMRQTALEGLNQGKTVDQLVRDGTIPNNPNLVEQIKSAIAGGDNTAINKIHAAPATGEGANGYVFAKGPKGSANYKPVAQTAELVASTPGTAVGRGLTKVGLSPKATPEGAFQASFRDNLSKRLTDAGVTLDRSTLQTLQEINKPGVSDLRGLSAQDIRNALPGYADKAPVIKKAISGAYADVPTSVAGLGPKAYNIAANKVPLLNKYVSTEQNLRYENKLTSLAFQGRRVVKGGLVTLAEGGGKAMATTEDAKALRDAGLFHSGGLRAGTDIAQSAEMAQGTKALGRVDQAYAANLAASIAKAHGTTVKEMLASGGELANQTKEAISHIGGYGSGGYLNSPLAKTLNLLVYPSRFDSKIAIEAAKAYSHQSVAVQAAVAHGVANGVQFLQSPQGKQWQKDNSELIGVLKYFTPTGTVSGFAKFISNGQHIGDIGELGGLPVGVLSAILEHQGINLGRLGASQYLDPKTGQPVPGKIPITTAARFQTGMTDLLNSLYSWPGKQVGLTQSKTAITQSLPGLKPAAKDVQSRLANGQPAPAAPSRVIPAGTTTTPLPKLGEKIAPVSRLSVPPATRTARIKGTRIKSVPVSKQIR